MTLPPSPNPFPTTEGPQLRDALAWALAELHGETRYDNPQQVAKCFESAYAALSAPTTEGVTQGWQVPDGWKLVPIEPTEEMLLASWMAQYIIAGATEQEAKNIARVRWADEKADVFKAYSAMIAAAPLPPPPGQ